MACAEGGEGREPPAGLLARILTRRMAACLALGFSSGLPLNLTGSTLQAWMTEEGVALGAIGLYSLVGLPYTLKFLWAPAMDAWRLPGPGRRRSWMLLTQAALLVAIMAVGLFPPASAPFMLGLAALVVAFASASQDIVVDAWRREALPDAELALGSALYVTGYRLGMLTAGGAALRLAEKTSWDRVYLAMALLMGVGLATSWLAPEPPPVPGTPQDFQAAVVEPFREYLARPKARVLLAFVLLYRLGDTLAAGMMTPFVLSVGFTKGEYAALVQELGLVATILGGLAGGVLVMKLGMRRALVGFGLLQAVSTVAFAALVATGKDLGVLAGLMVFENVSNGLGSAAYAAFMAKLCDRRFTATQFALLTSLMGVPRVVLATPAGFLAQAIGWGWFFGVCAALALPGLLLIDAVAEESAPPPGAPPAPG